MDQQQKKTSSGKMWPLAGIAAVALLVTLIGIIAAKSMWPDYVTLIEKGSNCQGVITKTAPPGECWAEYSFSIGGNIYHGSGSECGATVGEKVTVTYLADDPSHSCLGFAGVRLTKELVYSLLRGLSFPPL